MRFVGGVLRSLLLTFVGGVGFGFVQSLLSEGFFRDFVITQKSFLFYFIFFYSLIWEIRTIISCNDNVGYMLPNMA